MDMRKSLLALFSTAFLSSGLTGEIVVEFDGKEWNLPEGLDEITEEAVKDGVCYTADANVPAGSALKGVGVDQLLNHRVRFALRGQEGQGATLDPILPGKQEAENVIALLCEDGRIMAQHYPEEFTDGLPDPSGRGIMDDDFNGLENFLKIIRDEVKKADINGEIPRFCLVVKSKTSFGQMVRLIQLARSAGCMSGVVRVHDGLSELQFDPQANVNVSLPVAEIPKAEPSGNIVLNITEDGSLYVGNNLVLVDERDVTDFVNRERNRLEAKGLAARFQLRADRDAVFKFSRNAIKAAAEGGVKEACFAFYEVDPASQESPAKWRMKEIPVPFSKPDVALTKVRIEAFDPVEISINREDAISIAHEAGELGGDPGNRELPLLQVRLKAIAAAKGITKSDLRVSMRIDDFASQQRVIDVLNSLANLGVTHVTFADPPEKGDGK